AVKTRARSSVLALWSFVETGLMFSSTLCRIHQRLRTEDMADIESIWWDLDEGLDGNVQHIAEHGITKEEVEEVLGNRTNPTEESHSSGRPATCGWTTTGKHIIVIWEEVQEDPLTAYAVTAYEVPPPADR